MSADKKWDITFLQTKKILIAEDVPINRKLMEMLFAVQGITPDFVENGLQLLAKLPSEDYDVILMDLEMPEMDGYEATKVIRQKMMSNIPIIAISGYSEDLGLEKCLQVGMNDYTTKPIEMEELLSKIYRSLYTETPILHEEPKSGKTESAVINLDYIKSCSRGNKKYEQNILQMFLEDIPEQIVALRLALESGADNDVVQLAHKLRSSVAMLGIEACVQQIALLEKSPNQIEALLIQDRIESIINPCFQQIELLLAEEYYNDVIKEA